MLLVISQEVSGSLPMTINAKNKEHPIPTSNVGIGMLIWLADSSNLHLVVLFNGGVDFVGLH